jgi:hypothetical protein
MLFEHEMTRLEEMRDEIEIWIDHYMFDHIDKWDSQKVAICDFVQYVSDKIDEMIDEPRGKTGRTYREASKYP